MADWVQIANKTLGESNSAETKATQQGEMADGTKQSGFVTGSQNKPPRECGNCIWMAFASCGHPSIVSDKELKDRLNADGRVKVDEDDCSNHFQSQGNVLLWIVRHGVTTPDELGLHGGWIDDPLNDAGKQQAEDAKKYLAGKKFKHVISSDMDRAQETAGIIAPDHKRYVDKQLRPWDVGKFSGKDHDIYKDEFESYIKHPTVQIPDGESMAQFGMRMHSVLMKYVEFAKKNGPTLLVTHSRNFTQFKKHIEDKNEFKKPNDWDKVREGGIMVVLDEDGFLKVEIVYNRGDEADVNFSS
jgi:broad specificity phosphatase PhoE